MKNLILIFTLFIGACSTTSQISTNTNIVDIMNVIALSEASAPDGVKGTFQLPIKASGIQNNVTYLNTETNYRDRRNITVALKPDLIPAFIEKYDSAPSDYFVGKTIEVTGEAKRTKINFISRGILSKKYYFQTHIKVNSLKQIKILR